MKGIVRGIVFIKVWKRIRVWYFRKFLGGWSGSGGGGGRWREDILFYFFFWVFIF